MKVSVVLSIHNRLELTRRGLWSLCQQTLSKDLYELIFIDDMSSVDLRPLLLEYKGQLNIRHVKIDHTKHWSFRELNPDWDSGKGNFVNFFHTPALSNNIGFRLAKGEVLVITQPEIIHKPTNLQRLYDRCIDGGHQIFGLHWQSNLQFVRWLDQVGESWKQFYWDALLEIGGAKDSWPGHNTWYWYIMGVRKDWVFTVNGVDEIYMLGCCGEDDDFRNRIDWAGCSPQDDLEVVGIHQNHSDEGDHRLRDDRWWAGAEKNRIRYRDSLPKRKVLVNEGKQWGDLSCVVGDEVI